MDFLKFEKCLHAFKIEKIIKRRENESLENHTALDDCTIICELV